MFGLGMDLCRRTKGAAFRKTLGGDFKTHKILRKNPHAVDMEQKYRLLTVTHHPLRREKGETGTLCTRRSKRAISHSGTSTGTVTLC